jgi:phenylalanyl-tRNA synthetase beta chain
MKVSRRWLEAFLRRPLDSGDLVSRLAMLGLPVDEVEPLHGALMPVVVGVVSELVPHPNADRLQICQVEIGGGVRRQVVTGAPNVRLGGKYPFAPLGITLATGITLEKRKLRGEVSEGMLCSPDEIGLGSEHDGLLTLEVDDPPGTPLPVALGIADERLVLDISPVRGDLQGHKGVARELAAAFGVPLRLPDIGAERRAGGQAGGGSVEAAVRRIESWSGKLATGLEVAIEEGSSCRRFTAAVIEGVRVGPSPEWLRRRLESIGQRAINNLVDVTNYVMYELGQPLHGYDGDQLRGGLLRARLARPGETLTTLDGVDRKLPQGSTVVADRDGAIGVAGILGGQASEVTDRTTTLVLEAAWWEPKPTRTARRALGVATEASYRFERGTDLWAVPDALRRAAELAILVAGGRLVDAIDLWPTPSHPARLFLREAEVRRIIGIDLTLGEIERALVAIGATVLAKPDDARLAVDVPGWRRDLVAEIDLIEEIARIHGYDRLPDQIRPFRLGHRADAPIEVLCRRLRRAMTEEGLYEVVLLPIGPATDPHPVTIANPLSDDHRFLRGRLVPGLLRQVEANWAAQVRDVRLFEIGTGFARAQCVDRPMETIRLAGVISGARSPNHWTDGGHPADVDWWDLKGLFERALSLANPEARIQLEGQGFIALSPEGKPVGSARRETGDAPPWAAPVFGFEIEVSPAADRRRESFVAPPSHPAATRDLAVVIPWGITAERVIEEIRRVPGVAALAEAISVIDEYRGETLPEGTRSVAFRVTFRAKDRTLKDAEVDHAIGRIQQALERQLGLTLRQS